MNQVFRSFLFSWLILLSLSLNLSAQDFSTLWQAHFSYNDIVDVVSGTNKIYAAAQNAVFEYDTLTEEIKTITTVEGLSGEQITTILYSEEFQYLVVGYETGLIEVYSETDNSVLSVVDILEKENITPDNKSINHFYEYDGLVYISTDYGISVYDLARLEFGDTYYIGGGGSQIIVNQVTILNDEIFAACSSGNGLKKADLNNPNLIDFSQWQTVIGGNFLKINTVDNLAYAIRANRAFFEITNTSFTQLFVLPFTPLDTEVNDNSLIISSINTVQVYNEAAQLIETYSNNDDFDTRFTSAAQVNDEIYIGTEKFGVLKTSNEAGLIYTEVKPNGPLMNEIFKLNAESEVVWASFGDYTTAFDPAPQRARGLSYLKDEVWHNIPFDSVFGARNLSQISVNPFNPNQVFVSSFQNGILEINLVW